MTAVKRQKREQAPPKAEAASAPTFTNLIRMAEGFLVKVFVSPVQLRTLVGRKIVGIAPHPKGGGRSVPVYDVDNDGWLGKWFAFVVPFAEGIYDLSARAIDGDTDEIHIESSQVQVWKDADGVFQIKRLGYGEMIEAFGGARLKKGNDGALTEVSADAESF